MPWIETRTLKTGTTYRVMWRAGGRKQCSGAFDTEAEAQDYMTLLEADRILKGHLRDDAKARTPFRAVAEAWHTTRLKKAENTWKKERSVLEAQLYPEFGDRPIGDITIDDVQSWVDDSDATPASLDTYYAVLGAIMRYAQLRDYLPRGCPVGKGLITLPSGERRMIFLHDDEVEALLKVTRERFPASYPLIHLEAHTGLRLSEILGLQRTAYHPLRRTLTVAAATSKSGRDRVLALYPCCVDVLNDQLGGHEWDVIFPSQSGEVMNGSNWRKRVWYPVRKAAGYEEIGLHFHDLRHSHCSSLLAAGWDVVTVAERLGHKSAKMTLDVYGHAHVGGQERYISSATLPRSPGGRRTAAREHGGRES